MRGRQRIERYELKTEDLESRIAEIFASVAEADVRQRLEDTVQNVAAGTIVQARVIGTHPEGIVVDFGGKSEGLIPTDEFPDPPEVGGTYEVLYEGQDEETNTAIVSKRRADRMRAWDRIVGTYKEGDIVQGEVQRKIKGGLLVDVDGVSVFLPASQVNVRRTQDVGEYIGREVEAEIIKIEPDRMNIVVSRRKLLERQRAEAKEKLLAEIEEGQMREGIVKNIADFGVFVDIGGIDGLLHVTDMSWGRVGHPSEIVQEGQKIEVQVLRIDRERERIALGLKQKSKSPWEEIETSYPPASRHAGTVVNLMPYGAFVKLEDGVEGLVHVSEMSWTRRVNHPSEILKPGDTVDVVVLEINKEKQEISLGIKQTEQNPWLTVQDRYPPGTILEGKVRNLASYGAFVEIEEGIDGLLHVSDMSWTKKVTHPSEIVKKGDTLRCVVLSVDPEKKRIALGMKQLVPDPWQDDIPANFHVGDLVTGTVSKIASFGAFVRLNDELEGLLHISEISDRKIATPEEVVKAGYKVEVRVIKLDRDERKIGLSLVHADFEENEEIDRREHEKAERKRAKAAQKAAAKAKADEEEAGAASEDEPGAEGTAAAEVDAPSEEPAESADEPEGAPAEPADGPEKAPAEPPADETPPPSAS